MPTSCFFLFFCFFFEVGTGREKQANTRKRKPIWKVLNIHLFSLIDWWLKLNDWSQALRSGAQACLPYLFGPMSASKYIETLKAMEFIWPSDICHSLTHSLKQHHASMHLLPDVENTPRSSGLYFCKDTYLWTVYGPLWPAQKKKERKKQTKKPACITTNCFRKCVCFR